jgi:pSer/pThr/pTyr-binding forkhead associated (FHA) protein
VNGTKVAKDLALADGDVIAIGDTTIVFSNAK